MVAAFTFVSHLVDAPPAPQGDGVSWLLARLGPERGPAVLLAAVLLALGERAQVESTREISFVRVEVEGEDLPDLPPHAELLLAHGRTYLPLDPRRAPPPARASCPPDVRAILARRLSARQRPYWRSQRIGRARGLTRRRRARRLRRGLGRHRRLAAVGRAARRQRVVVPEIGRQRQVHVRALLEAPRVAARCPFSSMVQKKAEVDVSRM